MVRDSWVKVSVRVSDRSGAVVVDSSINLSHPIASHRPRCGLLLQIARSMFCIYKPCTNG